MYFLKNREYCVWYISPFRVKLRACKGERFARLFHGRAAPLQTPPAACRPQSAASLLLRPLRKARGPFKYLSEGALAAQAPKNVMVMSPISVAATRVRVPPKRSAMLLEPMFAVTPMV